MSKAHYRNCWRPCNPMSVLSAGSSWHSGTLRLHLAFLHNLKNDNATRIFCEFQLLLMLQNLLNISKLHWYRKYRQIWTYKWYEQVTHIQSVYRRFGSDATLEEIKSCKGFVRPHGMKTNVLTWKFCSFRLCKQGWETIDSVFIAVYYGGLCCSGAAIDHTTLHLN